MHVRKYDYIQGVDERRPCSLGVCALLLKRAVILVQPNKENGRLHDISVPRHAGQVVHSKYPQGQCDGSRSGPRGWFDAGKGRIR